MCISYDIPKIKTREKKKIQKRKVGRKRSPGEPVAPSDLSLISDPPILGGFTWRSQKEPPISNGKMNMSYVLENQNELLLKKDAVHINCDGRIK
jgi:hypothetical protein